MILICKHVSFIQVGPVHLVHFSAGALVILLQVLDKVHFSARAFEILLQVLDKVHFSAGALVILLQVPDAQYIDGQ